MNDPVFHFAWINYFLRGIPPQLSERVEEVVKAHGFDGLLCALSQSQDAKNHLCEVLHQACLEAKRNPGRLKATCEGIRRMVHPGAKIIEGKA